MVTRPAAKVSHKAPELVTMSTTEAAQAVAALVAELRKQCEGFSLGTTIFYRRGHPMGWINDDGAHEMFGDLK